MLTRREGYPESQPVPPLDIPEAGEYLWDWYRDASERIPRASEGMCKVIPPTEWLAWSTMTSEIVYPWEFDILTAMDLAFCAEMNKELDAKRRDMQDDAEKRAKRKGK